MPGWSGRVNIRPGSDGFAYVPGEVIVNVSDLAHVPIAARLLGCTICDAHSACDPPAGNESEPCCTFDASGVDPAGYLVITYQGDVPGAVARLRGAGLVAQPNHVFFADSARRRVTANPVYADPVYADPVYADPVYADPVYADPVYADPVYADPVYADRRHGGGGRPYGGCSCGSSHCRDTNPCTCQPRTGAGSMVDPNPILADNVYPAPAARRYQQTGVRRTNAVPMYPPTGTTLPPAAAAANEVRVAVIDTGWPMAAAALDSQYPDQDVSANLRERDRSGQDMPDFVPAGSAADPDGYMDPAAGHGLFIAGLINQYAPSAKVEVAGVLSTFGDGDENAIKNAIYELLGRESPPHILSLSFGTYAPEPPGALAEAIAKAIEQGVVVVASAGNDATSQKSFPGAYDGVVSVGALDIDGRPAPFSNWGDWVRACAPGVDVASSFWTFVSKSATGRPFDVDAYEGWALWSGTSFAAPIVAAHLAEKMRHQVTPGPDVVESAIDNPRLIRLPCYGTVINPPSALPQL